MDQKSGELNMFRLVTAFACLLAAGLETSVVSAYPKYPRVYGFTGRPYGPTQAHYQYRRQYGRPWHGYGGLNTSYRFATPYGYRRYYYHRHYHYSPYLYGYSRSYLGWPGFRLGLGWGGLYGGLGIYSYSFNPLSCGSLYYGPMYFGYGATSYGITPGYSGYSSGLSGLGTPNGTLHPGITFPQGQQAPFNNSALRQTLKENHLRWNKPLDIKSLDKKPAIRLKPSSLAAKRASIKFQSAGDEYLRKQEYSKALTRYRSAVAVASDRADAHFRMGYAYAALGKYDLAVDAFKLGLQLDPQWPQTGQSLGRIFGRENEIATSQMIGNVTRWAKADIRDPDRLFLIGVLLHFSNRTHQSSQVFEAAYRLAGGGRHLAAFLQNRKKESKIGEQNLAMKPDPRLEPPQPPVPPIAARKAEKESGPKLLVPTLPKP
ncbi:MAG: hypothetical protein Tsb009_07960 [Planctomycetaceae bacterium]